MPQDNSCVQAQRGLAWRTLPSINHLLKELWVMARSNMEQMLLIFTFAIHRIRGAHFYKPLINNCMFYLPVLLSFLFDLSQAWIDCTFVLYPMNLYNSVLMLAALDNLKVTTDDIENDNNMDLRHLTSLRIFKKHVCIPEDIRTWRNWGGKR